jgi:UDP-glucose 4-epimerase
MRKVCITGAGGYIGSVATHLFLSQGYEVVAVDNFTTGYKRPLEVLQDKFGKEKLSFYEANLTDDLSGILIKEKGIDAVIHYAASCSVDESMNNPAKYFSNNTCATHNFIHQIVEAGIKYLVFSSTCAVYGEAEYMPIDEKHPTNPANPYGESKKMSEKIISWYGRLKGLNYVILRYFNVCGATDDGLIGDAKKPSVHLMQNAVRGALSLEKFSLTCSKFNTQDGSPIRDYVNVVDLNEAHLQALEYLQKGGKSEIINIGTGSGNSVLEIVQTVQNITGKKFDVGQAKARQGEYAKMVASIDKAKNIIGWQPKRSIKDSVQSLVKWYKGLPGGWEY